MTADARELRRRRTFYVGTPGGSDLRAAFVVDGRDYTDPDQVRADIVAAVDALHRRRLPAQLFTEPVEPDSPRPDLPAWTTWAGLGEAASRQHQDQETR